MNAIRNFIRRGAMAAAIIIGLFATATTAYADAWDGLTVSTTFPAGEGTAENPYRITCAADFLLLVKDETYWNKHFIQTADISLDGITLPNSIGTGKYTNNANSYDSASPTYKPFKGTYDGMGHVLSDFVMLWNEGSDNLLTFGLFGFFTGQLRNLHVDNALLTRTRAGNMKHDPIKMGLVIASLSPQRKDTDNGTEVMVENIIVTNSKITDNGYAFATNGMYIGGVIADISTGMTSYKHINAAWSNVIIRNIYSNVDFDLPNGRNESSSICQYNIGGVLGRQRRGRYADSPDYIYYTGTVEAPGATVGPNWGAVRNGGSGSNYNETLSALIGEYLTSTAENSTAVTNEGTTYKTDYLRYADGDTFEYRGETITPEAHRYFGAYTIKHAGTETTFTDTYPAYDLSRIYGKYVRTVANTGKITQDPADMYSFQGVGRVTYAPSFLSAKPDFDAYIDSRNGALTKIAMSGEKPRFATSAYINAERTGLDQVTFTIEGGSTVVDYTIEWEAIGREGYANLTGTVEHAPLTGIVTIPEIGKYTGITLVLNFSGGPTTSFYVALDNTTASLERISGHDFAVTYTNHEDYIDEGRHTYTLTGLTREETPREVTLGTYTEPAPETLTIAQPDLYSKVLYKVAIDGVVYDVAEQEIVMLPHFIMTQEDVHTISAELIIPYPDLSYIYKWEGFNGFAWEPFTPVTQTDTAGKSTITIADDDGYSYYRVYPYLDDTTPYTFVNGDPFFGEIVHHSNLWFDYRVEIVPTTDSDGQLIYIAEVRDQDNNIVMGGPDNVQMPGYTFTWNVSSDPTSRRSWENALYDADSSYRIYATQPDRFYRVSWVRVISDGLDNTAFELIKERVRGPINVVFVYDKAKSAQGRARGVTTFDGIDRWIDADGVLHEEEFPDGDDLETGYGPYHAVNTMRRAYELLEADKGVDGNLIVVMGYYYDYNFLQIGEVAKNTYAKPCEITGRRGALVYDGALNIALYGASDSEPSVLQAATRFSEITFVGYVVYNADAATGIKYPKGMLSTILGNGTLYCNRHDLTIGDNVKVKRYSLMNSTVGGTGLSMGLLDGSKAPNFTIVGGIHNYNDKYLPERPNNVEPDITTITINSGCWGRIIAGARNNNSSKKNSVFGTPERPHRVKVNISITHMSTDANEFHPDDVYDYDIGLLTGGQTDGSIYAETVLFMNSGSVGRFISGSISYGRRLNDVTDAQGNIKYNIPADSYFGSTVFTMQGGSIRELYGGSLGRKGPGTDTPMCEAYFYGRSIINIDGGTIGYPEKFVQDDPSTWGNIYTAGAGGVSGLGDDINHTADDHIPYYAVDGDSEVWYGTYEQIAERFPGVNQVATRLPSLNLIMESKDSRKTLNLADSYCELYLTAGTIYGSVYGGGFGYSSQIPVEFALSQAGNLYGHTRVVVNGSRSESVTIKGNVYGGGAGSDGFYKAELTNKDRFKQVGCLYGDTHVDISTGTIEGSVYGGAQGISGFPEMGTVLGSTNLNIHGYPTIMGNIFGGSGLTSVSRRQEYADGPYVGGDITMEITEYPTIGNNIFGGCEGIADETDDNGIILTPGTPTTVEGNVDVTISGGSFLPDPYIRKVDSNGVETKTPRTFNIYGGGYRNCTINGAVNLLVTKSLLDYEESIMPPEDNPQCPPDYKTPFDGAFRDDTYRRFCVYGGGFGEQTCVLGKTTVNIYIPTDVAGYVIPSALAPDIINPGQTFFDIAGGGYCGNIGRWAANEDGTDLYDHYEGGEIELNIKGYPFIRKVIGGGFYGSSNTTVTNFISGGAGSIYGGALLGYVHNNAYLTIGTKADEPGVDAAEAAFNNSHIFVSGNVYGGNDVKGIVGTEKWVGPDGAMGSEESDGAPLFFADVSDADNKGVNLDIFGGTFLGNVYGAGNGHYRGYYVPEWVRYEDGPKRHYRKVHSSVDPSGYGYAYRSRPMVGSVKMNIRGNSTTDAITIKGNVFGGGKSCTIGQWNSILPFEDPRRLHTGGFLHVNFGGFTTIEGNVYMGAQGELFGNQAVVPEHIDISTFKGLTLTELLDLGDAAYDHWYWDEEKQHYMLGFPSGGTMGGNSQLTGEHMFRGYMKNVEMNGDVELTFYRDLYDNNGKRKRWLPIELAVTQYDASDITMNSFFLGGQNGSMTNNLVMAYEYMTPSSTPGSPSAESIEIEEYASIYRFTLANVTVLDKVVCGSENGVVNYYAYSDDCHSIIKEDEHGNDSPVYSFEGGLVTQSIFTYDMIVWNDRNYEANGGRINRFGLPEDDHNDYLLTPADPSYYKHTLTHFSPGTTIYRYNYDTSTTLHPNSYGLTDNYALAVTSDSPTFKADGKTLDPASISGAFVGPRDSRPNTTVVKAAIACTFDPQSDGTPKAEGELALAHRSGGLVYGGCYRSGITTGDVILLVSSNTLGKDLDLSEERNFGSISSLKYNIGRVYGGGYGSLTRIEGNTYVNLLRNFVGMNVFGGGMQGSVTGKATINYVGTEEGSFIYGAIYGGGLRGSVGTPGVTTEGTDLNLISGNVDKVYGGSCMGDIYGSAHVDLYDEVVEDLPHFDFKKLLEFTALNGWGGSRLIAGSVFGGNDIAGNIILPDDADENIYHTNVRVFEKQDEASSTHRGARRKSNTPNSEISPLETEEVDDTEDVNGPGKTSPGSDNGYNGFPLIGNLYGGSNGNYGFHLGAPRYLSGSVEMATGVGTAFITIPLDSDYQTGDAFEVPHIDRSRISIEGGTVINAYGGGDMSTINERCDINIAYGEGNDHARAGFASPEELDRMWNVFHLSHDQQRDEVMTQTDDGYIFDYQIFRIFGGNDNADMAIQPGWSLHRAHIGSLYSGGNFGRMTYYENIPVTDPDTGDPTDEMTPRGLTLTIDSPTLHAARVFGGGRIGDINPQTAQSVEYKRRRDAAKAQAEAEANGETVENDIEAAFVSEEDEEFYETYYADFYGATLNIIDGVIDHVYGGNDVAGDVAYGTNVNIYGAISGNVYCAGNGNYLYQYDPSRPEGTSVEEIYNDDYEGRYFILPCRAGYGGDNPNFAQKVLAINSWRPNVNKSKLNIQGLSEDHIAFVRGNVFCGGNSATVFSEIDHPEKNNIIFNMGNNVVLNGVFLGSNGESLVEGKMMHYTELLNNFSLAAANDFTDTEAEMLAEDGTGEAARDAEVLDKSLYSKLLDVYMRAVEVNATPRDFDFPADLTNAYLGTFYAGGNCGSMMTDRTIRLTFPESLVVYGQIFGGSRAANVFYNNTNHIGGLTRPLLHPEANPNKVELIVKSRFEPWKLAAVPEDDGDVHQVELQPNLTIIDGKPYFDDQVCKIFGGCYSSGRTVGGIAIDLYSDLVGDYDPSSRIGAALETVYPDLDKRQAIVNSIDDYQWRSFSVAGGGYGGQTEVWGDIHLRMLPGKAFATPMEQESPSVATIFGGSHEGLVVGNTTIELRDGKVLANMYGGSEASPMYGSTQIIVGWPQYYVCNTPGTAILDRTDKISRAVVDSDFKNADGKPVIRKMVSHRKGDIISRNVWNIMTDEDKARYTLVDTDTPNNFTVDGTTRNITWDDIDINVGDVRSRTDDDAVFYRHGNIYGGGFISATGHTAIASRNSVCRFNKTYNLGDGGYNPTDTIRSAGGNSTILIWDNFENADPARNIGAAAASDGSIIRDHVSVGTGIYAPVTDLKPGQDLMGLYMLDEDPSSPTYGKKVHQSPYILGSARDEHGNKLGANDPKLNNKYYRIESDGGVYGGGRKVYVENFRDCDIAYYGYADYSPQFPKLLNTAQRIDLLTLTDCCLQFQGASDYAANSVDATSYSLTRIGELQLISSIDQNTELDPGQRESSGLYNILHTTPRSRNYVSFFRSVLYVSAITSSQDFDAPYRGANGKFYAIGDFTRDGNIAPVADAATPEGCSYNALDSETGFNYDDYKANRINNFYANRDAIAAADEGNSAMQSFQVKTSLEFDQRNVGTAPNMIGINNGYVLRVQGARTDDADVDHVYYGPITGVVEIKLLTLAKDEGGGYIFALNKHADGDDQTFLETTGNFVFPGAAYRVSDTQGEEYNYIYDDCFPLGQGYDHYYEKAHNHDVDDYLNNHGGQEIHYWYVNGTKFFYNVTLTAYTYPEERDFHLDRNDDLIYFYGTTPGKTRFSVEDVHWETFDDGYDHDIPVADSTDGEYDRDYRLYFSVDKDSRATHTLDNNADNAFVFAIPRSDYDPEAGSTDLVATAGTGTDVALVNNYKDYSATEQNMPLLGITLLDNVDNSAKTYYEDHLKPDAKVRLTVKAQETDEHGILTGTTFYYTVNLTVRYLLGPVIHGLPVIENGALPGEYIFANSFDVTVDLDDSNMTVNERNWYIVAPEHMIDDNHKIEDIINWVKSPDEEHHYNAECINDQKFDNDRQVHIPAFLYRNGWHLVYEIVANNMSFFLHPDSQFSEAVHPEKPCSDHLVVHNYHRMRPYDGSSLQLNNDGTPKLDTNNNTIPKLEELEITRGARIYIEDDDDMAYFYEWLDNCQSAPKRFTPRGYEIDPQYGQGLEVYLMSDVTMPELTVEQQAHIAGLVFGGTFHGNGHTIEMGKNRVFLGHNHGSFYNTGFVSLLDDLVNEPVVFRENIGLIESCFFYNPKNVQVGTLAERIDSDVLTGQTGQIVNCFQTTPQPDGVTGLRQATVEEFNYGEIAYNLNRFYLKKRYNIATETPDGDLVEPVNAIYRSGDYRFAQWSPTGEPTAIRTDKIPNYRDFRGIRIGFIMENYGAITGADASMHNPMDPVDETRADRDEDGNIILDRFNQATYTPNFPFDYLFFGQNLSDIATIAAGPVVKTYPGVPTTITEANRVYRASGFYGSNVDYGFHFNAQAMAQQPTLTAIDFSGYRDHYTGNDVYGFEYENIYDDQHVYYPPALDMPDEMYLFNVDEAVTRNLLIYHRHGDAITNEALEPLHYERETPAEDIVAHLIDARHRDAEGNPEDPDAVVIPAEVPQTEYFHLIDRADFDCPIAFDVTNVAWYQRKPEVYSNGNDAWEGLCIPFTTTMVYSTVATTSANPVRDHGELTHFYGTAECGFDEDNNEEADSHEYWLRKFTDVQTETVDGEKSYKIYFTRPASTEDLRVDNPVEEKSLTPYHYSNDYFSRVYGTGYTEESSHARAAYTAQGIDYRNYPYITQRMPYLISYPGIRFYEFDLSGEFYEQHFPGTVRTPQLITYAHPGLVRILVSTLNPPLLIAHDGYKYGGVYMKKKADAYTAMVNEDPGSNRTEFVRADVGDYVEPFRTYLVMPSSQIIPLRISSRNVDGALPGVDDPDKDLSDEFNDIEIYIEDNDLIVVSPYDDLSLPLFDYGGRLVRHLSIHSGENRFSDLSANTYLLLHTKFRIR